MPKLFGGGAKQAKAAPQAAAAAAGKKLFTPEQVKTATGDYSKQGEAKWNQIMSGMGAGGGTGGDFSNAIQNQASTLGSKLSELTDQSGYGAEGNIGDIMKQLEGGIGAQYKVY